MTLPSIPLWEKKQLAVAESNNVFLIDWLTFVSHVDDVDSIKRLLGLNDPAIPWADETKFRNGYPLQCYWEGITISYGADREEFYSDPTKIRIDMGVCVNLSGKGCRSFETYGHGNWMQLFAAFFSGAKYNITRLDLAYDDHIGILDIDEIESDTRSGNFTSRANYSEVVWSYNKDTDVRGMTVQIGSDKSRTKIRIYDKAAERGYNDRHWVRCELQLRDTNAKVACAKIFDERHIGKIASGVLRNYVTYRSPTSDTNKSRWPVAPYWSRMILDMVRISLWITPGDPYNYSKTMEWLVRQCGQALLTAKKMKQLGFLMVQIERENPELLPKYQRTLDEYDRRCALARGESPLEDTESPAYSLYDTDRDRS